MTFLAGLLVGLLAGLLVGALLVCFVWAWLDHDRVWPT